MTVAKRLASLFAPLLLALVSVAPSAGAAQVIETRYHGCTSGWGNHFRFTELGVREDNGHQHKAFFVDVYALSGHLLRGAAFQADAPWQVWVASVSMQGSDCHFTLCPYPGMANSVNYIYDSATGPTAGTGAWWLNGHIRYGNWRKDGYVYTPAGGVHPCVALIGR